MTEPLPLSGLRVVDAAPRPAGQIGRLLAELGAEVVCFARQDGLPDQRSGILDLLARRGKIECIIPRGCSEGQERLDRLLGESDIIIAGDALARFGRGEVRELARRFPHLVVLSVSDFGLTGPLAGWRGSEVVYQALGGQLSRSGIPERAPLPAPGGIASGAAMTQAAFVALTAYMRRLATGEGGLIDFAIAEGAAQALDPGFGIQGSATSGIPATKLPRGRPEARFQYPILPCKDGFARVCALSPRQWQGMFEWLGKPDEFADPSFASLFARYQSRTLVPAIGRLFACKTRAQIEAEAIRFGVPAAGLATLDEALGNEHFTARGSTEEVTLPSGETVRCVASPFEFDGRRASRCSRDDPFERWPERDEALQLDWRTRDAKRPLEGLRVLDFGVIVVGAEAGRLLADQGADVIKIENPSYPDGARQTRKGSLISPGFAAGHRNKRSLAVDLRTAEGRQLLLDLAASSDVVLANFKPGTMESLGLGAEDLLAANPRLAIVESSAFGSTGPWSARGGYGPLVRAAAGLTYLWRYDDDPLGFSDALTVYPDHAAGRISAVAALALLVRRARTARGGVARISQAEVMLWHLEPMIATAECGDKNPALRLVVRCAGDDEWCAVETRDQAERRLLADMLGLPEEASAEDLRGALAVRFADLAPQAASEQLQAQGVPAAPMLRVQEMERHPYYLARDFLRPLVHPHLDADYVSENAPVGDWILPGPPDRPAPLMGEHSVEIARDLLGFEMGRIEDLLERGILFRPAVGGNA